MKTAFKALSGTICLLLTLSASAQNAFPPPQTANDQNNVDGEALCLAKFKASGRKASRIEKKHELCKALAFEVTDTKVADVSWSNFLMCLDLSEKNFKDAPALAIRCAREDHNDWVLKDMSFCEANIKANLPRADIENNCATEFKGESFISSDFNACVQNIKDLDEKDDEKLEICSMKNGHYQAACFAQVKNFLNEKESWRQCAKYDVSVASVKKEFPKCMRTLAPHSTELTALNFCSDRDSDKAMTCFERGLDDFAPGLLVSKCSDWRMRTHVNDWRLKACHNKTISAKFSADQGLDICLGARDELDEIARSKNFSACASALENQTGMNSKHSFLSCVDGSIRRNFNEQGLLSCVKKGVEATLLGYFDSRGDELIQNSSSAQKIEEISPYYWVFNDCEEDGASSASFENEYVKLHSDYNIHSDTVLLNAKKKLGGLSALRFDQKSKKAYFLTDDKGWRGQQRVHVFNYTMNNGRLSLGSDKEITLKVSEPLMGGPGTAPSFNDMDPEGLVLLPSGDLIVSAELSDPASSDFLNIFGPNGERKGNIELDSSFEREREEQSFLDSIAGAFRAGGNYRKVIKGLQNNKGLEALSLSPDSTRLFTANEASLIQDDYLGKEKRQCERTVYPRGRGNRRGKPKKEKYTCYKSIGDVVRLLTYSKSSEDFVQDGVYLYRLDNERDNGLVEVLSLDNNRLLTMERSWDPAKRKISAKIYLVDLSAEANLLAPDKAINKDNLSEKVAAKKLVLDFDELVPDLAPGFRRLENFEGLAFGPTLEDGTPTLAVVSDNNFSRDQRTLLLLLKVDLPALMTAKVNEEE